MKNIQFVNDDCVEVYYTQGDGFVPMSDKTNVVIAAFTTANARLKLHSVLERLQTRVLYYERCWLSWFNMIDELIVCLTIESQRCGSRRFDRHTTGLHQAMVLTDCVTV